MNQDIKQAYLKRGVDPESIPSVTLVNPFLIQNPIPALRIIDKYKNYEYYTDRSEKVFIFLGEDTMDKLMEMENITKNVFLYVLNLLEKNAFEVDIKFDPMKELMDISLSSYYSSLAKLTELELIVKKKKSVYWINPHYIFKGARTIAVMKTFGPQYVHVVAVLKKSVDELLY